jgi:hypothetical protein
MGGFMSSVIITGDTSGAITLAAPTVAGTNTITLPANTGTVITTASTAVVTQAMLSTNVAGNGPAFTAYRSGNQNISQNTYTKVQFNAETFDTNSNFDSTTNYRFTPTTAGYYQLNGQIQFNTSGTVLIIAIYKNGTQAQASTLAASVGAGSMVSISSLVSANGSSDYFEIFAYSDNASPQINSTTNTYFSGFLARAA